MHRVPLWKKVGVVKTAFNRIDAGVQAVNGLKVVLVGLGVYAAVRSNVVSTLQDWQEKKRRELRLREVRFKLIGPVTRAVEVMYSHLEEAFLSGSGVEGEPPHFVQLAQAGLVKEAVDQSLYHFCVYFFWRYSLQESLLFESVGADDFWQHAVDRGLRDETCAFEKMSRALAVEVSGAKATVHPFRLPALHRQAISEVMRGEKVAEHQYKPLSYVDFVAKIEKAEQDSADPFSRWVLPLRGDIARFAELTSDPSTLEASPSAPRELAAAKARLALVSQELRDLLYILRKEPSDPWFKQKRHLHNEETRPEDYAKLTSIKE